jgi:predicted nucleotidyltransferase
MLTQQTVKNTVRDFAKEIVSQGIPLRKVILYGSFAKGTQHEWSDIDVALVADDFTGVGFIDKERFSNIGIKNKYVRIETKTYPTDYFNEDDPFVNEIEKTGILIN